MLNILHKRQKMIKVLVLQRVSHVAHNVPSLSVAARITEALEYLQDQNTIIYIAIDETDPLTDTALKWADILILSKHSSDHALQVVHLAKQLSKRIIYDVDDWIFSFPSYSNAKDQAKKLDNIKKIIELADHITVANTTIFKAIQEFVSNPILVPNGMYVERYLSQETFDEYQPPRIVFTNADMLKMEYSKETFLKVLQIFSIQHPEYLLDFYGDPFPEMHSIPFLHFTNRMPYPDFMKSLVAGKYQFAITPLGGIEDEESYFFNSCKNPFKYLNYGNACVPGIYSKAPIYTNECVTHGKTGLLIDNTIDEWIDAMENFAINKSLRDTIRSNAFKDIKQNYHIKQSADVLYALMS